MPTPEQRAIADRWFQDVFGRGDPAAATALLAPDFVAHGQGGDPSVAGPESFKAWLRWYTASFTDREWAVEDVIGEGDRVAVRYSGHVTYRGGLLDIPAKNQRVTETGMLFMRLEDGRIRELWSEMSDLQLVMALGAFPCKEK